MEKTAKKNTTYKLVVTAIMVALANVLNQFAVIQLTFGGGITIFSQVPIIAVGFIFGPAWGLAGGLAMSVLQLIFGLSNFAYVKGLGTYIIVALFDYIVPYTILGLGGIFKGKFKNAFIDIGIGTILVCFIRFLCHYITGAIVWGEWMPETFFGLKMTSPWVYSALYNGGYMLPETLVTLVGVFAVVKFLIPKLDSNGMIK